MRPVGLWTLAVMIGLAMLGPSVVAQGAKESERQQQVKQIKLTEKQVQSYIAAQKELTAITDKMEGAAAEKPDPKMQADRSVASASIGELLDLVQMRRCVTGQIQLPSALSAKPG